MSETSILASTGKLKLLKIAIGALLMVHIFRTKGKIHSTKDDQGTFEPSQGYKDHWPGVSGNEINGVGETEFRPPTPVLWHSDTSKVVHGPLQDWYKGTGVAPHAIMHAMKTMRFKAKSEYKVAKETPDWTPAEWSENLKTAALEREADLVGIARVDRNWVFDTYDVPYEYVIIVGVQMDYDIMKTAPSTHFQSECQNQYGRGTRAAYKLAEWLNSHGVDAVPHGGPEAGPVALIPAAIAAGMGELGKHGSIINREYGSSFRLACVMTNLPLVEDKPDIFGADDFCLNCNVCANVCPVDAIVHEKMPVRGVEKWYVDFDACVPYFMHRNGCGACIGQCPWSRPGVSKNLIEKKKRRDDASEAA